MRTLTILGSTGSIGQSTLDVVRRRRDEFGVFALVAGSNVQLLASQVREFHPRVVVVASEQARRDLIDKIGDIGLDSGRRPEVLTGERAKVEAATSGEVDFVMSAIVGVAGLEATYEAVRQGKQLGLANKEVLVASGKLVVDAATESGTNVIPVDSEHNGAHQCLKAGRRDEVARLILTASGGPFRKTPMAEMGSVTPAQALKHPTWKMGRRITIDSATLMNKGFEVIEACWLFGFTPSEVDVVVHPQSSVHALVEFADGSVLAQVSVTDMRMPIQYALTYPDRLEAPVKRYDWSREHSWEFAPPDMEKFPLLKLAYEAQEAGGSSTCTLNAADEVAVEAFLEGKIPFTAIAEIVRETLDGVMKRQPASVAEVLDVDRESRRVARKIVERRAGTWQNARPAVTA